MPKLSNDIKKDKIKNRPFLLPPIINTIVSVVVITGLIILKVKESMFSWGLFICFVLILVLFPIATWYSSYYSKKQKTKMLGNFEKETELVIEYVQHQKKFKMFEENEKVKVTVTYEETNLLENTFTYNSEKSSLGFPDYSVAMVSIGIGFAGLEIDPETQNVIGIKGLLPRSIWQKKKIKFPVSKKAIVKVDTLGVEIRSKTYIQIQKQSDTYYDKQSGLLLVGEKKIYEIDEVIEFINGAYLVIREGKICSLIINVGQDISIY